jgi:hypothetical protein
VIYCLLECSVLALNPWRRSVPVTPIILVELFTFEGKLIISIRITKRRRKKGGGKLRDD